MKLFKNKKNKALVAAVTMSLVMGVCGNAMVEAVTIENTTVNDNVYGVIKYGVDEYAYHGIVDIKNAIVNANVIGGRAGVGYGALASFNTVNIEKATITGTVTGGYARSAGANYNTVNLKNNSVVTGNVDTAFGRNVLHSNVVNVDNYVRVDGTVSGSRTFEDSCTIRDNALNIHGISNEFGGIAGFQSINIDILGKDCKMLSVKDSIDFSGLQTFNVNNSKNYVPDTTLTLLYSDKTDFTKLSKDKLRIDGQAKEETAIDRSALSNIKDLKAIDAVACFDVLPNAINFVTMYKLVDTLNVDKNIQLNSRLNLNGQTINMQQKPEETAKYNTLTVSKLIGEGNLGIDVDLAGNQNDKLVIAGKDHDATITLNNVVVRSDLPGEDFLTENNKVTVIDCDYEHGANLNGFTFNVANGAVKASTADYIYTFTNGTEPGKLNVSKREAITIADFIQGKERYADVNSYTLTKNKFADRDLGTTYRAGENKELTIAFNKGTVLSGIEKNSEGAVVAEGYTLKLQGADGQNAGKMTQFKGAAVTNNGTLNVSNVKFEGNDKDIVNNGTLNLTDTNTIQELSNAGTANIHGNNTITKLSNTGTASFNNDYSIKELSNAGTVNLRGRQAGRYTIGAVAGPGTINVNGGVNKVTGTFDQQVLNVNGGGYLTLAGKVSIKEVNVNTGGTLNLEGNTSSFVEKSAQGNTVNIKGGTVVRHIYGGFSKDNAYENTINISNRRSSVWKDVYGACSMGDAYRNTVNIRDGVVFKDVYGGLTSKNGTAYENTVNISGGEIRGNVYGGISVDGKGSNHHDNVINISGGTVYGVIYGGSADDMANNLLHVTGSNNSYIYAGNIANFQSLGFTMPNGYDRNKALLTLEKYQNTNLNLNRDVAVFLTSSSKDRLKKGDKVCLIEKYDDSTFKLTGISEKTALYFVSPLYILKGELKTASWDDDSIANDLIFTAGDIFRSDKVTPIPEQVKPEQDVKPNQLSPQQQPNHKPAPAPESTPELNPDIQPEPKSEPAPGQKPEPEDTINYEEIYNEIMDNAKSLMETRANGAALLNESSDFLMKQGLSNARMAAEQSKAEGDSSMAPFAAIGGGNMRYKTGSHVDSKSWHGAVGLAKQVKDLTFGIAIQQGKSNYDAYVNKAHSEGHSKSVGGALFAEKKISNGLHYDAAVRAGRIKNKYNAMLSYSVPGLDPYDVRYDESSTFYGLSLGMGKEISLKNKDKIDVYGRYAWTHTGSSEITTSCEDELKFNSINSHRILLGSRYIHAVNERNELYAGLGWQYELGGKVKGSAYGYSTPEPGLKGGSGMLELGWKVAAEENFSVDFNVNGLTGKQRGVMGGVNMQWKF